MPKYKLNLSFDIDITADEEEEMSEQEMVEMLQQLYCNDRKEFLDAFRYYFEKEKVVFYVKINPQKINTEN